MKTCPFAIVKCPITGFDVLRKEVGNYDYIGRMDEHIAKSKSKNDETSEKLNRLTEQKKELKDRLDKMTIENNNETMKMTQQIEHLEKENETILHDINTIPSGEVTKTRQDEINDLNEYDNVTPKTVSTHIKRVDKHINTHSDEINAEFMRVQERLLDHFKMFANSVRDKFNTDIIQVGINKEFDKLSPIKGKDDDSGDDRQDTNEDSVLSDINEPEDRQPNDCLNPEMNALKENLNQAYASPMKGYQTTINTTADFRKSETVQSDVQFMDTIKKQDQNGSATSSDRFNRREQMKKRLQSSKFNKKSKSKGLNQVPKTARYINAFDEEDPYPDEKFTETLTNAMVDPSNFTPTRSVSPFDTIRSGKSKFSTISNANNVRKKKNDVIKTLLYSNRNR